jgi:hypothetical protein
MTVNMSGRIIAKPEQIRRSQPIQISVDSRVVRAHVKPVHACPCKPPPLAATQERPMPVASDLGAKARHKYGTMATCERPLTFLTGCTVN